MTALEEIAHVADVKVSLDMELDCKIIPLKEILDWQPGSVVWLTRSAGENLDILVGGALVGYGEIVVIENTFGVRITDFASDQVVAAPAPE